MGFLSSIFGGGSTKTKVKRDIPKPSEEEKFLLSKIMETANAGGPYHTNQNLLDFLKTPYQTQQALPGFISFLQNPYVPGREMMAPFDFYKSPLWQWSLMRPLLGRGMPQSSLYQNILSQYGGQNGR